jgi:hypothetical protein
MNGAVTGLSLETGEDNLILTRFLFHATVDFNLYKALKGVFGCAMGCAAHRTPKFLSC